MQCMRVGLLQTLLFNTLIIVADVALLLFDISCWMMNDGEILQKMT